MTDRDPCAGCRHLVQTAAPGRPTCDRNTYYGEPRCRPERGPAPWSPPGNPPRARSSWR